MKSTYLPFLAPAALLISSLSVQGAIVYVDAQEGASGNTFRTSDGDTTAWVASGTQDTSDVWGNRAFANDATIFEGRNNTSGETDVPLTTQLTGLADGTYNIWAFFWGNNNASHNWDILAGLNQGSLTKYDEDGVATQGIEASTLSFTNSPDPTEGPRSMRGANLGTATVTGGSVVNIFIDADGSADGGTERTWYDGVGYEVVPEPSSFGLIAGFLGLTWIMLRRRRA